MENKKTNDLVVKSNEIVEASYKLSVQEQRIILYMASLIQKDDAEFNIVKLSIDEFTKLLGLTGKSKYKEMKEIASKLRRRELIIIKPKSELRMSWLASEEYFSGEGYIELEFSSKLKPYLLQLKERFTKFQLKDVIRLKHVYSIRFFELLKQYESIGWRYFELEELRKILGIELGEYKLYGDFKKYVVTPVKKEFDLKYSNGELDFTFDYEEKKACRRVTGLRFEILKPEIKQKTVEIKVEGFDIGLSQEALEVELSAFKLSKKQIIILTKKYAPEVIRRNIELVQKKAANNELKSVPAFLFNAIEGDFAGNQAQDYNPAESGLIAEANKCWVRCKGGCAGIWDNYKSNKEHICHYCKKFKEQKIREGSMG